MYNVIVQLEHQSCGGVVGTLTKARNGYLVRKSPATIR
jgi:hypothetical protein